MLCGEEFFQHETSFDRSSLTRWRQRMGEEKLDASNNRVLGRLVVSAAVVCARRAMI
jgi:transposase, IS5 family